MKLLVSHFGIVTLGLCLLFSLHVNSQADFKIQHLQVDVPGGGTTTLNAPADFDAVANLNNAFIIVSNNRRNGAGPSGSGGNTETRDLSCTANFTGTTSIALERGSGTTVTTRVNLMIVEYIGAASGPNEFIVRHRGTVTPVNGTTPQTLTMTSTPTDINKCIPFYSVRTADASDGGAANTLMLFLSGADTLNYHRGGAATTVNAIVEVVEFTGSNWSVGHGDSGTVNTVTGSITLNTSSTGTGGSVFDVGSYNNAFIWHTYKGDSNSDTNQAIADNYPVYTPNGTTGVDWTFNANHGGATERHFVHVLANPNMVVTRFTDTSNSANESTIDITSAGLTDEYQALILGSSTSSGGGTAYGRGWRNYYFNSTTEAAHWAHRNGNTMSHNIQIIDLVGLSTLAPQIDVTDAVAAAISDASANSPLLGNNTDFGTIDLSTSSSYDYTINNTGTDVLNISSITSSNATDFVVSSVPTTVTAGSSAMFTVTFTANAVPTSTSVITINNDDPDTAEQAYTFTVQGTGQAPSPIMSVEGLGNPIAGDASNTPAIGDDSDFGVIYHVSGSDTHTFTIYNTGSVDLTIGSITLGGTNPGDFTVDTTGMLTTIPNGGSTTFDVTFDPSAIGTRTATVSIVNNDTSPADYVFNIEGEGNVPTFTDVTVDIDWPANSEANRVEIYSPSGVLLATIDNGYTGSGSTSYSTSVNLSCIEETNDYYYIMYDVSDNGWNGADNITISTSGGDIVNTDDGDNATLAGYTTYFNVSGPDCGAEIDVKGNATSIIGDGSNTPSVLDHTNFGNVQIVSETLTRTFTIYNLGGADLTLGTISLSGSADFSITSAPTSGTILGITGSATVDVAFSTTLESLQTATLTILSTGDSGEETYAINLSALGAEVFFDSDGDGVFDDVDIDDDNDGIEDSDEENACRLSSGATQADYKFLNETFGAGTGRGTGISSLYTAYTSYTLEDGTAGSYAGSVGDGKYTIASFITDEVSLPGPDYGVTPTGPEIARWGWYAWAPIDDHTPGDTDGRMAIFNASYAPGVFYETEIKGTLANVPISYSFWVINIDEPDQNFIDNEHGGNASAYSHRNLPNVTVNFLSSDRSTVIATFDTGDITRCGDTFDATAHSGTYPHIDASDGGYNSCLESVWQQFTQQFTTTETSFIVQFINNAPGGAGNDLALDDIEIRQTLCDMDSDAVADVFDLDSDDDGIPDVVEANPTAASLSAGRGNLTGIVGWTDTNSNGMHDPLESIAPVDTDSDGIPDYLDLDSDNDGLFDVDESGAINTNDVTFQNGDGDITGDGTGDELETENFREKDSDGDGTIEGYGDGILDIYDFHEGNTNYTDSYGNNGQGTAPLYALDSDSDGIPDYKDPYNDITTTYDIDTVEIYAGLPNTGGVLDSTTDADGDGIMASRDGDDSVFGSPRNLDDSYSLYFDGRNDYVEDSNVIASGSASIMAFVKSGGANTSGDDRIIAGQDDFYIRVNDTGNTVTAVSEGISLTSTSTVPVGIWMHVALTTEAGGDVVLYINGEEEARDASSSGGITSVSNFMIGRATADSNYFNGDIDEVRVFDKALSTNELQRMVYQELDDANSFNRGKIIPIDISAGLGANLVKYYKMDGYDDDILDDKTTVARDITGAKMYNFKDIYFQRAPLPYETAADGDWTNAASWVNGSEWDINSKQDNPNGASIVHIQHNIDLNGTYDTQGTVGLIVDSGREFSIETDKGLYNSWYLLLHGLIDLDDESQLVQTENSILDTDSAGRLEKDQQGTKDLYTYNYWSSPVGLVNTSTNNTTFTLNNNILKNGTVSATPNNITFLTSSYNGNVSGTDIEIADYWIWKYTNNISNSYALWQHVRSSGAITPGQGFTMKGVESSPTSPISTQNYVFDGKPNNGDITLTITAGHDYLVGNPYPSALDADEFIKDNISDLETDGRNTNGNIINGVLYFWDHFASTSHILAEYEGGYATYTLMGGAEAINNDARISATGSTGTKVPERYIPVGQGFFVSATLDIDLNNDGEDLDMDLIPDPDPNDPQLTQSIDGGQLIFKNSQRAFEREGASSLFLKSKNTKKAAANKSSDDRERIKLMFDSPDGYHRQLLLGADDNCSTNFDLGYDGPLNEENKEDIYWKQGNAKLVIQAINKFDEHQTLPLGLKIDKAGIATLKIDDLENIDSYLNIFVRDKDLNTFHNLRDNDYTVHIDAGVHNDRFEITFAESSSSLGNDTFEYESIQILYSKDKESIIISNPSALKIKSLQVYNILAQEIASKEYDTNNSLLEFKLGRTKTVAGVYIIKLEADEKTISKKIIIK